MKNKINIGTGNFRYYNYTLLEKLELLENFNGFNGIEISEGDYYKFNDKELELLKKYEYNTFHLGTFNKEMIEWVEYCIKTIPNFYHFTLHPDAATLEDIPKNLEKYISFENMDIRKPSHRQPEEMVDLFKQFPNAGFTYDINHAEENNIDYDKFDIVKHPNKIHFSVVNKDYYLDNPEIETPHALACLEKGFNFDLTKYKDCIITLEGVFVPGKNHLIQDEIDLANKLLNA